MALKLPQEELPSMNLTSMIDILFLLIIFFMVGTNFGDPEKHLKLNLPKSSAGSDLGRTTAKVVVSLKNSGQVDVDGQPIALQDLARFLAQKKRSFPGLTCAIRCEANASAQQIVDVQGAIATAGFEQVAMTVSSGSYRR